MQKGFDIGNVRQGEDAFAPDVLVMGNVAGDHREADIDAAKEGLDFEEFRHLAGGGDEFVKGAGVGFVEGDAEGHFDGEAKRAPVDHGFLALEDAGFLKPCEAAGEDGGRGACRFGQLGSRARRIGLEVPQNAPIEIVQHEFSRNRASDE